MLSFQVPFRPEEVHSSGWKLVFKSNQCTVPEITTFLQDSTNSMRNLHLVQVVSDHVVTPMVSLVVIFGTRTVWGVYWPCEKLLSKSQVCIIHCSHGPAKWTCWCCSWPLAALAGTLKLLLPNQSATTLKTPTFEWTTSDQYDKFKLFWESTDSWFCLQAIQDEPDNKGACLEHILIFLSTTARNVTSGDLLVWPQMILQVPKRVWNPSWII